jgi:hypothetical protein
MCVSKIVTQTKKEKERKKEKALGARWEDEGNGSRAIVKERGRGVRAAPLFTPGARYGSYVGEAHGR